MQHCDYWSSLNAALALRKSFFFSFSRIAHTSSNVKCSACVDFECGLVLETTLWGCRDLDPTKLAHTTVSFIWNQPSHFPPRCSMLLEDENVCKYKHFCPTSAFPVWFLVFLKQGCYSVWDLLYDQAPGSGLCHGAETNAVIAPAQNNINKNVVVLWCLFWVLINPYVQD